MTNRQNRQDNRNTVAYHNNIPEAEKHIKVRLAEIANQRPPSETTVTNHLEHPAPDRCQFTNHSEHQFQSTYTNQNRSYTNSYNQNYNCTWKSHTDRTCNSCGTKGHIAIHCTKTAFWCQWSHTTTHDTQACRSKPRSSTPMESPSAGSYHPHFNHLTSIILQTILAVGSSSTHPHHTAITSSIRQWQGMGKTSSHSLWRNRNTTTGK